MRPGWNPARRNRHVGTKAHGHGANNRLTIPESWHELKCYFEKLSSYVVVTKSIGERELKFFVEPTRSDWFYPCTVDDICAVLSHCSVNVLNSFDFVVMRQPTRKQRILCPVWGRAIFSFDIDKHRGAAIVIEAQDLAPIDWDKSITPEYTRELERLRKDGHEIRNVRRGIQIHTTPNSLRNTVLYRTFLHEIGHHIDYSQSSSEEWDAKTKPVKEDYAHRYASELYGLLSKQGVLPFKPIIDDKSLLADGLNREWFCLS
ncbi:hypothetical protein [Chitiniphilus eburneus]|uniref:Uncharacterized protein n=1 Tax=Chitiniphilus eburneus TaxID=2571148 RepID=A0A4U0PJW8_9NEIS|nr:hypothetical protein [Chitiniphilus eburneus]TJZ68373.1 hypothetical protein FAZ21_15715 [Chitiniphilus eburneus]